MELVDGAGVEFHTELKLGTVTGVPAVGWKLGAEAGFEECFVVLRTFVSLAEQGFR